MKISLVLSGGGARGYIHIGIIEELKKSGIDIISISGTSMGALVGGLEAAGKLDKYKEWVLKFEILDFLDFLNISFNKPLLSLDKVFNKIREFTGDINIEDLNIKFTAVATDLTRNKEIWFQKGDLLSAIKASSSIPGVFEPVKINNRIFVDGGVLNLMPIAPVMSDMSDKIIAINLNGRPSNIKRKKSLLDKVFSQRTDSVNLSINLMMDTIFRYRKAEYEADIELEVPRNIAYWYDFDRAEEMIEYGRKRAKEIISRLD